MMITIYTLYSFIIIIIRVRVMGIRADCPPPTCPHWLSTFNKCIIYSIEYFIKILFHCLQKYKTKAKHF